MNAKAHLEEAISLNPEFAEAYYKLGLLLQEENEQDFSLGPQGKSLR